MLRRNSWMMIFVGALLGALAMNGINFYENRTSAAADVTYSEHCTQACAECSLSCPAAQNNTGVLTVDRARCIGCTRCVAIAPKTFAMDKENKAKVINPQGDKPEIIQRAINSCPKKAISYR